ncbi:MAG: hypothetical protein IT347_14050 [Candidatus Eisenbacteria bacterium]|nr:hypothetical protein [Candidatus Eisenbacteria bacterium]
MRPRSPALTLLALLLAGAAWSAPRIPAVAPPPSARAGGEYVTALPELPAGVDECELLLLPDDGSGRAIRLTPEREADDGPLRWRMPRVHASRARLVLRAGGRFGETESAPSEYFAIEAGAPQEPAEVLRGEAEIAWHFGEEGGGRAEALRSSGAAFFAGAARMHASAPRPRGPLAGLPEAGQQAGALLEVPKESPPPAPPTSRRPAFVPLRN